MELEDLVESCRLNGGSEFDLCVTLFEQMCDDQAGDENLGLILGATAAALVNEYFFDEDDVRDALAYVQADAFLMSSQVAL